jgi:hypothetical protein
MRQQQHGAVLRALAAASFSSNSSGLAVLGALTMAVARRLQELSVRWRSDAQLYSYDRFQVRTRV